MTNNFTKKALLSALTMLVFGVTTALAIVPINVGVFLPLHNDDGDGKRAIEYYRGLILAAEEMKNEGVEVNFYAWNAHINADVKKILQDPNAKKCDFFFGPMYTKQLATLQKFAAENKAKIIIPFSIQGDPSSHYNNVFQIYQEPNFARTEAIKKYATQFADCHTVVVGCGDENSTKGDFTAELRGLLTGKNMAYTLTSLATPNDLFVKAFNPKKRNMVVLNSSSNKSLKEAFKKLEALKTENPNLQISMFGYTEWLTYANDYAPFYHKFDMYIPTHSYFNPADSKTQNIMRQYKQRFNCDMMSQNNPRFGLMGYDHGRFFFRGFSKMGRDYKGIYANNDALQTRIYFGKVGQNGGMQNIGSKFIHYNTNKTVSVIEF